MPQNNLDEWKTFKEQLNNRYLVKRNRQEIKQKIKMDPESVEINAK